MQLNQKNIEHLLSKKSGRLKASIYIPTNPASNSQSVTQDRTRFKNALQVVRNHQVYNEAELGKVMDKIYQDLYEDLEFWKYQESSLAVLLSNDGYEFFKMPYEITENEYVTDHFIVSPLLVVASADTSFYLLDVNFTKPRLLKSTHGNLSEIKTADLPGSLDAAVGRDEYLDQRQHHAGTSTFHGHDEENAVTADHKKYLKLVAEATDKYLAGHSQPLLLMGTTNRTGNVHQFINYPHLLKETLEGNFEDSHLNDIFKSASEIINRYFTDDMDDQIKSLEGTKPGLVVMGTKVIEEAADAGRVEKLFLPTYKLTTDSISPSSQERLVIELPSDIEEIETMVVKVLHHAGKIVPTEIGAHKILNEPKAICRF